MATIINNPDSGEPAGGGFGMIIGAIIVIAIIVLFFVYGLPAIRGGSSGTSSETNVNVPESVQVDVDPNSSN